MTMTMAVAVAPAQQRFTWHGFFEFVEKLGNRLSSARQNPHYVTLESHSHLPRFCSHHLVFDRAKDRFVVYADRKLMGLRKSSAFSKPSTFPLIMFQSKATCTTEARRQSERFGVPIRDHQRPPVQQRR